MDTKKRLLQSLWYLKCLQHGPSTITSYNLELSDYIDSDTLLLLPSSSNRPQAIGKASTGRKQKTANKRTQDKKSQAERDHKETPVPPDKALTTTSASNYAEMVRVAGVGETVRKGEARDCMDPRGTEIWP